MVNYHTCSLQWGDSVNNTQSTQHRLLNKRQRSKWLTDTGDKYLCPEHHTTSSDDRQHHSTSVLVRKQIFRQALKLGLVHNTRTVCAEQGLPPYQSEAECSLLHSADTQHTSRDHSIHNSSLTVHKSPDTRNHHW